VLLHNRRLCITQDIYDMIKHESNKKYNGFSHVGSKEIIVFSKVKVI